MEEQSRRTWLQRKCRQDCSLGGWSEGEKCWPVGMGLHGKERKEERRKIRPNSWIKKEDNHHPTQPTSINEIWIRHPINSCRMRELWVCSSLICFQSSPTDRGRNERWNLSSELQENSAYSMQCLFWCGKTFHSKSGDGNHFAYRPRDIWCFVDCVLRSPSDEPIQCSKATTAYVDAVQILWLLTFCSQTESVRMGMLRFRDLKKRKQKEGEVGSLL